MVIYLFIYLFIYLPFVLSIMVKFFHEHRVIYCVCNFILNGIYNIRFRTSLPLCSYFAIIDACSLTLKTSGISEIQVMIFCFPLLHPHFFRKLAKFCFLTASESSSHRFVFYVRPVWPNVYAQSICTAFVSFLSILMLLLCTIYNLF